MAERRQRVFTALGLMSGTSLDGVDAALLRTDGRAHVELGEALTVPYDSGLRERIRAVFGGVGAVDEVGRALTVAHAEAVERLLRASKLGAGDVDVIGFHGQTILHRPAERRTWQIGDGNLLAEMAGIAVVDDFRSHDIALGGQGAPLVPLFHAARCQTLERPVAVLNIGGVANVTWIGAGCDAEADVPEDIVAFDTGPGNALIDDWVRTRTGQAWDIDGALARAGKVDERALAALLANPYFDLPPPKSLDRNDFDPAPLVGLSVADGAATLTAFTAAAAARASEHLPARPKRWLATGGGRRNPVLMAALSQAFGWEVLPVEAVEWDGDALEAQAFAYLAVRSILDLPLSLPSTTGVPQPTRGGRLHQVPGKPGLKVG
ncbi:MAG TPA: anhydro-N-acetylmuramic acid kinase [Alphaproteobacteria bacterium]|jgi:anhydro-N-acetylmuramic acid kinase|nr:anhydro-N-acetylmuramic acid kinase [Alphaproteobacteria bacterium]